MSAGIGVKEDKYYSQETHNKENSPSPAKQQEKLFFSLSPLLSVQNQKPDSDKPQNRRNPSGEWYLHQHIDDAAVPDDRIGKSGLPEAGNQHCRGKVCNQQNVQCKSFSRLPHKKRQCTEQRPKRQIGIVTLSRKQCQIEHERCSKVEHLSPPHRLHGKKSCRHAHRQCQKASVGIHVAHGRGKNICRRISHLHALKSQEIHPEVIGDAEDAHKQRNRQKSIQKPSPHLPVSCNQECRQHIEGNHHKTAVTSLGPGPGLLPPLRADRRRNDQKPEHQQKPDVYRLSSPVPGHHRIHKLSRFPASEGLHIPEGPAADELCSTSQKSQGHHCVADALKLQNIIIKVVIDHRKHAEHRQQKYCTQNRQRPVIRKCMP